MKMIKTILIVTVTLFILSIGSVYAEVKPDCEKIKNNTIMGNIKHMMCKRDSNKLDKDGNFKKGAFNPFKKIKNF
jgi:hypothetical protein